MNGLTSVSLGLLLLVVIVPQHNCNPFFWYTPRVAAPRTSSQSGSAAAANSTVQTSNVSVAVGNRINTNTTLDDYGTNIDGLTLNVARRRRRRDLWDDIGASIPSIPAIVGNGSLNGSYIAIDDQVFRLPDQLSNLTLNVVSAPQAANLSSAFIPAIPENYTDAFRALVTRYESLPLDTLDCIVEFLGAGYNNSFGQLFLENGFARLNQSLEYGHSVVQAALRNLTTQGAQGFEQLIDNFNTSTTRVQRCVGSNLKPTSVAQAVVGRGVGCIDEKWQELSRLAGNIGLDIVEADRGANQFLANLTACNGANFEVLNGTATQTSSLRRQCYVQAVQTFPQSLLFLPVSLSIDAAQLYASIQSLQTDMAVCGSQMALEIGLVTSQIGSRILLCQLTSA